MKGSLECSDHANGVVADLEPDEWDLQPKPKWMRWATYDRYEDRYDRCVAVLRLRMRGFGRKAREKVLLVNQ
jgi:hypothetical protein